MLFAQSTVASSVNEDVVESAPTGDATTTSEWSTISLPINVRLILRDFMVHHFCVEIHYKFYTYCSVTSGGAFQTCRWALTSKTLKFKCCIKIVSFNVWVRYFVWNFKGTLWNSAQNILPIHWKMCILFPCEYLRALRFKSSYVFLKRPPGNLSTTRVKLGNTSHYLQN